MTQSQNPAPQQSEAKKDRRAMLEAFLAAHPDDAFALYGLAIECANRNDTAAAQQYFETLLAKHPDYVTGYFQYGQMLARISRPQEARNTLTAGIAAAYRTGDSHAADEMQSALALLPL